MSYFVSFASGYLAMDFLILFASKVYLHEHEPRLYLNIKAVICLFDIALTDKKSSHITAVRIEQLHPPCLLHLPIHHRLVDLLNVLRTVTEISRVICTFIKLDSLLRYLHLP